VSRPAGRDTREVRTRRPPASAASALLGLGLALGLVGCREAKPSRDALHEAFRDDALTALEARGHAVFVARCATCHGPEGAGDGQNASNLSPQPPDFRVSLAKLTPVDRRKVVESGTAALGRSPLCPPWGRTLVPEEKDALAAWLDAVARRPPPADEAPDPQAWRKRRRSSRERP
jgi:mono/diheme cytochrome c family protein